MNAGIDTASVTARLQALAVVPVVVLDQARDADPLADALIGGGLPCAEVTFRTGAAQAAIAALASRPEMLVGAGTVLTTDQADRALAAGARFIVTPGIDVAVVRHCRRLGVPIFPGVATASEIQTAIREGIDVVKLFPAGPLGGLPLLAALAAPFAGMRFIPTGGIGPAELADYLRHPAVLAVGGSWLVKRELLAAGDFDAVRRLAAEAKATATAATPTATAATAAAATAAAVSPSP